MEAILSHEQARGCGYRKPAKSGVGVYLIGGNLARGCDRLPIPLGVCPCCSAGIKPSRSWTWIDPKLMFQKAPICPARPELSAPRSLGTADCHTCFSGDAMPEGRHGLLWIGEKFYPTPFHFVREAQRMGVSRKIHAIPNDFELGKTVVFLAHRFAVENPDGTRSPGVFSVFKPSGVDLVVSDKDNVPERAQNLAEKIGDGCRILQVVPAPAQTTLPMVDA